VAVKTCKVENDLTVSEKFLEEACKLKNCLKFNFILNSNYGMVWYGMVWYGMVWCGIIWYGVVGGFHGRLENKNSPRVSIDFC